MKTRVQKIKQWCKDNPDSAVAVAVVTTFTGLVAVAVVAGVKEQKKQNNWISEQEAAGRRVLCLFDETLVAVNPDYVTY